MHVRYTLALAGAAVLAPVLMISPPQTTVEAQSSTNVQQQQAAGQQEEALRARDLLPLSPRETTFRITEGEDEGEQVTLRLDRAESAEVDWWLTLEGYNRTGLVLRDDGSIMIRRLEFEDENKAIVYDPPVVLLPETIRSGESPSSTSRAKVYNLETGELEHEGRAKHAIDTVSRARFQTPVGEVAGHYIEISHAVNLDLAELRLRLECGYRRGTGMIHRRVVYTIEKIGLFGDTTTRQAEIDEPIEETSAAAEAEGD